MSYSLYIKRLNKLKELILSGNAKCPTQLSIEFNCSDKTIRRMINVLREDGISIYYCRKRKQYYAE